MTQSEKVASLARQIRERLAVVQYSYLDENAVASRDWWGIIAHTVATVGDCRYWECFDALESLMSDPEYARTVRELWVSIGVSDSNEASRRLLNHGRNICQSMWMRDDDAQTFASLPELVTVFRGCKADSRKGWSWTLRREYAERIAMRIGPSVIVVGTVRKEDIVALFSGEGVFEAEVVVPGEKVAISTITQFDLPGCQ